MRILLILLFLTVSLAMASPGSGVMVNTADAAVVMIVPMNSAVSPPIEVISVLNNAEAENPMVSISPPVKKSGTIESPGTFCLFSKNAVAYAAGTNTLFKESKGSSVNVHKIFVVALNAEANFWVMKQTKEASGTHKIAMISHLVT